MLIGEPEPPLVAAPPTVATKRTPPETIRPATVSQTQRSSPSVEGPRVESQPTPEALPPVEAVVSSPAASSIRSERLIEIAERQELDRAPQLLVEPKPGEVLGGALRADALVPAGPIDKAEPSAKPVTGEWVVPSPDPPARAPVVASLPNLPAVASAPPRVQVAPRYDPGRDSPSAGGSRPRNRLAS